ncbi:hypothetical protein CRYUN_Cryun12cG0155600 [Craigia yunnanensis]
MMEEAIIDIPAIPRINELESVNTRRHSTGKVIMPNGGLTVFSRYLRTSQGSCHDLCKYGTRCTLERESKIPRSPTPKIVTPKRVGAGRTLERTESNLGERRKKSEVSLKLSPAFKIQEPDDPVVIKISQTQGGCHVENADANLTDRKKSEISVMRSGCTKPQKPEHPVVSLKPSADDLVDIKTTAAEGKAQDEENAETKLSKGEKKPEVSLKPFPDSKSPKPFGPDCIESEESSWTDKEFVSPKKLLLPLKETDAVAQARDSKLKPQSKPSSLLRQASSSGKQNIKGSKSKETNLMSMTPVSSGKNKGKMTIRKGIRTSVLGDKKNVVALSVSLLPKESSTSVSSMNAKKKKSIGGSRSKKQEIAKQIKPEKSYGKNAKGSKNQKGVAHLMDQENVKKPNSEEASFPDIPEKTLYIIKSNPENMPAESIENSVHASDFSTMPSSSSKDKSMKNTRNRIPINQSLRSYEKKNMIHRPKGIHARGLPPSLSSFPGKKGLRSTPYGLNVTQPSLTSSSSLTSSKSPHGDALSQHDEVAAQKQKSSSKMMYKGRPKMALITTTKDKHLRGEKLNFQRGKVIEVPLEDCTPRRLAFKQRVLIDNRNRDKRKEKVEDCTPKRLKFRRRVLVDNRNGDNQNGGEELTPRRLKFRRRVHVDNRNSDNQNDRGEDCTPRKLKWRRRVLDDNNTGYIQNSEGDTSKNNSEGKEANIGQDNEVPLEDCTPRRLAFKQRVLIDNRNGDNRKEKVEDCSPKRLKFRRRVLVDNRNADNENGGEEFTPRRLKFRQRVIVDNRNADNQNDRGEDCTPRKLKWRRRVLDDNNTGDIQNSEGDASKNNSEGKNADVGQDNATEVQSDKISLRHNDVEKKKDAGSLYNNMIEETASRLVRTKTRKVKALVSAFESVIFHLDTGSRQQIKYTEL